MPISIMAAWLEEALLLKGGEELYIPGETKQAVKKLIKDFLIEKEKIAKVDAVVASTLDYTTKFRENKFWLVIQKNSYSPFVGFKKTLTGSMEKIILNSDLSRKRRLHLMVEDGMSLFKIEEILGPLTIEEKQLFFKGSENENDKNAGFITRL